jgi:hypothetical protein
MADIATGETKAYLDGVLNYVKAKAPNNTVNPLVDPAPTPTVKPALPDFAKAKIQGDNVNAHSVNAKIDHIQTLAEIGDVDGLLALSFGSNNYAKKQVKLVNDALAALGSPHQVATSQKAHTHVGIGDNSAKAGLVGATTAATTGSITGAFTATAKPTAAQGAAAGIKQLADQLKNAEDDGGIGTVAQILDGYGHDPNYVKLYLGVVATSDSYSAQVKALAQQALTDPDAGNALLAAWSAQKTPTTTATTGGWANQYGSGSAAGLTTTVTSLGLKAKTAKFRPENLNTPPDYNNHNGPGMGLSSQPEKNLKSNQIAQELYAIAQTGDVAALKAYDIAAQSPSSQTQAVVGSYQKQLISQINEMLHPSTPVQTYRIGGEVTPANLAPTLQQAFPKYKGYDAAFADTANLIGRYAVLGSLENKSFTKIKQAADQMEKTMYTKNSSVITDLHTQTHDAYEALSPAEKSAVKNYTGHYYDQWNTAISTNNIESNPQIKVAMQAYEKLSVPLPPGTVTSRKWTTPYEMKGDMINQLLASEGKVVQDFGMISTSIDRHVWSGNVMMRITTLPGARGAYVDAVPGSNKHITKNLGEKEIVMNSKTRFLVTKVSNKNYDSGYFDSNSADVYMDVLALPEDPKGSVLDTL